MSKLWSGRDDAGKQIPSPPGSSLRLELHFRNGGPSISGMNHTALEDKLGYRFNNPDLLVQAVTHPSTDSKPETRRAYERLEFLGDAILQLAVTQYLYHHMPQSPEGELTQLRARTVSRANLGKYGFILGLDKHIALGKGEERAGGRGKYSIIANTFESVFGAMSLDSDYETAKAVALRVLHEALDSAASHPRSGPKGNSRLSFRTSCPKLLPMKRKKKGRETPKTVLNPAFSGMVTPLEPAPGPARERRKWPPPQMPWTPGHGSA